MYKDELKKLLNSSITCNIRLLWKYNLIRFLLQYLGSEVTPELFKLLKMLVFLNYNYPASLSIPENPRKSNYFLSGKQRISVESSSPKNTTGSKFLLWDIKSSEIFSNLCILKIQVTENMSLYHVGNTEILSPNMSKREILKSWNTASKRFFLMKTWSRKHIYLYKHYPMF